MPKEMLDTTKVYTLVDPAGFAASLRAARLKEGYTQSELTDKLNIPQCLISQLERAWHVGVSPRNWKRIGQLCATLGLSVPAHRNEPGRPFGVYNQYETFTPAPKDPPKMAQPSLLGGGYTTITDAPAGGSGITSLLSNMKSVQTMFDELREPPPAPKEARSAVIATVQSVMVLWEAGILPSEQALRYVSTCLKVADAATSP